VPFIVAVVAAVTASQARSPLAACSTTVAFEVDSRRPRPAA
jgi:hypothetical protein